MVGQKKGFTILELLAVMVIIAIVAGMGVKGYNLARRQAKESQAKAEIEKLRTALEEFRVEYGRYPASAGRQSMADLVAGLSAEQGELIEGSVEGLEYLDPWGNAYQYVCSNRFVYSIWSEGQNRLEDSDNINPARVGY